MFLRIGVFAALLALTPGLAAAQTFEVRSEKIPFTHRSQDLGGNGLGGAVWFDYDRDGDVDLFLGNGPGLADALYRNDGAGRFTDVAAAAGLADRLGTTGAVAGDLDNDGDQVSLLLGDGGFLSPTPAVIRLYRNDGDGTFTDITPASGITLPETQTSAALGDVDNDGLLDLFITAPGSIPFQVQYRNRLYHNDGGLTFSDVSAAAGVDTALGGCVASFSDYDRDGWSDLFVGNCGDVQARPTPLELFHNDGDGTFTEVADQAGLGGLPGLWMGLALADIDNDGDIDVFVSNAGVAPPVGVLPHGLFRNNGNGTFTNLALKVGLDRERWAWGAALRDFDNDGWADLFFTGAFPSPFNPTVFLGPNGEGNYGVLWHNDQDGTWSDRSASLGHDFRHDYSTGVAAGDYDGDGFEDLVVMLTSLPPLAESGQPVLLRNRGNANRSLQVRTVGTVSNRDGVGARVSVDVRGLVQTQEVYAGSSLNSMHSQILTFGLGRHLRGTVDVQWPSGFRNRVYGVLAGEELVVSEIPCSFDDPELTIGAYSRCVTRALTRMVADGQVGPLEKARLLASALRAYHETH